MDDLRNLWQNQEVEKMQIPIEQLRLRAARFQRHIRCRNAREQVACVVVIVAFGAMCGKISETVPRIAFGLIIAGAIYVAWHIQVWGSAGSLPAEMGRASCLEYHRRELQRQRDLLGNIWKWYLGPLIPGLALFEGWGIAVAPPGKRWLPTACAIGTAAFFWFIGWLNVRAANHFSRRIEELDRELRSV